MKEIAADKPSWVPRIRGMVAHTKLQSALAEAMCELFSAFDVDNNGVLDINEINFLVSTCLKTVNEEQESPGKLSDVFKSVQCGMGAGKSAVSKDEFLKAIEKAEAEVAPAGSEDEDEAKRRWVECIHAKARSLATNASRASKQEMPLGVKTPQVEADKEERKCGCSVQ